MNLLVEFAALVGAIANAPPVITAIGVAYLIVQDTRRGRQLARLERALLPPRPPPPPPPVHHHPTTESVTP